MLSTSSRRPPPSAFSCQATAYSPPDLRRCTDTRTGPRPASSTKGAGFRSLLDDRHRAGQQALVDGQRRLEREARARLARRAPRARPPAPAGRRARSCARSTEPASVRSGPATTRRPTATAARRPPVQLAARSRAAGGRWAAAGRASIGSTPLAVVGDVGAAQLERQRLPAFVLGRRTPSRPAGRCPGTPPPPTSSAAASTPDPGGRGRRASRCRRTVGARARPPRRRGRPPGRPWGGPSPGQSNVPPRPRRDDSSRRVEVCDH